MTFNHFKHSAVLMVLSLALAGAALAHHSFAMFDFSKTLTLTGQVEEFRWTNPHVTLLAAATPKAGEAPDVWSFELTSPGNLSRLGWTRTSLKPGDRIKLEYSPLRDGRHGGAFAKATLLDTGQVLISSVNAANEPSTVK